jgi:hypothetical protein
MMTEKELLDKALSGAELSDYEYACLMKMYLKYKLQKVLPSTIEVS